MATERPRRRQLTARVMWRLELACGHTAFATNDETHRAGLVRFCYAHDRYVRILTADEFSFKTSNVSSRTPMKNHEVE
jgi:hypothetical protein